MFFPQWFGIVFLLVYAIGGALLGALIGWISSSLLRWDGTSRWRDAAMGVSAIFMLCILLAASVARGTTTSINGHTLGMRGLVLDHLVLWALGLICLAVLGRQLLGAQGSRHDPEAASPQSEASSK